MTLKGGGYKDKRDYKEIHKRWNKRTQEGTWIKKNKSHVLGQKSEEDAHGGNLQKKKQVGEEKKLGNKERHEGKGPANVCS